MSVVEELIREMERDPEAWEQVYAEEIAEMEKNLYGHYRPHIMDRIMTGAGGKHAQR